MKLSELTAKLAEPTFKPRQHYLAYVLDESSRSKLLATYPPKFKGVIAHHVTLEFNLNLDYLEKQLSTYLKHDKIFTVEVYGYACGDHVECVAVTVDNFKDRADGSFYHVTLSLEPPGKAYDSNKLKALVKLATKLKLTGTLELLKK